LLFGVIGKILKGYNMSMLKVKILQKQGMPLEEAYKTVLSEVMKKNQELDFKIAECMDYLKPEDFEKLFPFEKPVSISFKVCRRCGRELNSMGVCPNCIS
jgi:hypothetical protein